MLYVNLDISHFMATTYIKSQITTNHIMLQKKIDIFRAKCNMNQIDLLHLMLNSRNTAFICDMLITIEK